MHSSNGTKRSKSKFLLAAQTVGNLRPLLAALSLFASGACLAAPEEIHVYLDEFAVPGKFGLDFHTNYVLFAKPGSITRRMLRVTPELSYGINENWEAGFYWLTSAGPDQSGGSPVTDGVKVRAKWRPHAMTADSPWYGAINFELGQRPTPRVPSVRWRPGPNATPVRSDRCAGLGPGNSPRSSKNGR